jgi:hypothetical protein
MAFQEEPGRGAGGVDPGLVGDEADSLAGEERLLVPGQDIDPELDRSLGGAEAKEERAQPNDPFSVSRLPHRS